MLSSGALACRHQVGLECEDSASRACLFLARFSLQPSDDWAKWTLRCPLKMLSDDWAKQTLGRPLKKLGDDWAKQAFERPLKQKQHAHARMGSKQHTRAHLRSTPGRR